VTEGSAASSFEFAKCEPLLSILLSPDVRGGYVVTNRRRPSGGHPPSSRRFDLTPP
jgi:hypothetical protein